MLNLIKSNKGSSTIEASLIISTLILVIMGTIFAFLLLYQKTLLVKAASAAAQQGSEIWVDLRRYDEISFLEKDNNVSLGELYQQLFDFGRDYKVELNIMDRGKEQRGRGALQDMKLWKIEEIVCNELHRGLFNPEKTELTINFSNRVLERKITVIVKQKVRIPLGGIKSFFGGGDTLTLTGTGTAVVAEPDEYIRNVDLGLEYANRALDVISMRKKIDEFKEKVFGGG